MGERHTEEMRLLGLTIAFYRRARGLTQSELAEAVQISRTHMSNIEAPNSHTSLSLNKLMDIAEALDFYPPVLAYGRGVQRNIDP